MALQSWAESRRRLNWQPPPLLNADLEALSCGSYGSDQNPWRTPPSSTRPRCCERNTPLPRGGKDHDSTNRCMRWFVSITPGPRHAVFDEARSLWRHNVAPHGFGPKHVAPLTWIKSIGVPFCHPLAKGISIGRSFCHILCHIAILRAKSEHDGQKDSYSHPLCQRRGPIERRATASLERASSKLLSLPCHRPSARGLRTMQGDHLCWKVLIESS